MIRIGAIVWGVLNVDRAVRFWCEVLDYMPKYPPEEEWAILIPREGTGTQLSINQVTSPKARRHHMDLFAQDRDAEMERLIGLGASRVNWNYPEGDNDYVVMADPEGNPFCLIQA